MEVAGLKCPYIKTLNESFNPLHSKEWHKFPVKLTDPITSVLYITSDHQHMQELKHAIHVKEINEGR